MAGLKDRRVVLGVCGSIAAYKACDLVRRLTERGAQVRVALTPTAEKFVSPLTLGVLAGSPALESAHDPALWKMAHLDLADWAEAVLVAPATADCLSRLASGRAELLLDSLILAAEAPVILCPAMDEVMWRHPATQENVKRLQKYGYALWGPAQGALASGKTGWGRLLEPLDIAERLEKLLAKPDASRKPR